ncbi:MAG TPA: hypothetical protein VGY55_20465 [Pirellulales bacterium]|nr:hypothetical protein [Pirellulales bacterium]
MRYCICVVIGCLPGLMSVSFAADEKPRDRPALVDYFPPAEEQGGWRSLLPEQG